MTDEKKIPPLSEEELQEIGVRLGTSLALAKPGPGRDLLAMGVRLLHEVRRIQEALSRVRAEEREACAKIAEERTRGGAYLFGAGEITAEIRARGEKT